MEEFGTEKPQQLILIEYNKADFNNEFFRLRGEGYRATQVSVASTPVPNNAAKCVFMALMEF